jgi:hypothetical protein
MAATAWQATGEPEQWLLAAREGDDAPAFLSGLARADLLLLLPDGAAGSWAVSRIEDRPCLVAFTSVGAMTAVLGRTAPHRRVRVAELATTWPDPSWSLAVDPGLPIEAYLDAGTVQDVAALSAQPATRLERALLRALEAGDIETYVAVLMPMPVLLPSTGAGSPSADVSDPAFAWFRLPAENPANHDNPVNPANPVNPVNQVDADERAAVDDAGAGPIVAFTSPERLRDQVGDRTFVQVPFPAVVHAWPDAGSDLVVDPGLPHGGVLAGSAMAHLRAMVDALSPRD